jgi:deoxyribose-phosphate aldolase
MIIKKLIDFINENQVQSTNYNSKIDYTALSELSNDDIKKLCDTVKSNNFYAVSVLPQYVSLVSSFLDDYEAKVCAVVDFPKGDLSTSEKIEEIEKALINGADEIDIVVNYKLLKNNEEEELENEIRSICEYVHKEGEIVKIIIEIGDLNYQELEKICQMCVASNVDYIMTSTGKLSRDNSFEEKIEKLKFMRKILPNDTKIKFSGGLRTNSQIEQILPFCDRIGTSVIPQ